MGIEVRNLCLRAGHFQLRGINLKVNDGEYSVLLGPTGSGKTLTLEAIAGLRKISKGQIFINEMDKTASPPHVRGIGYVPQKVCLFPHISVWKNVTFGLRYHAEGMNEREVKALLRDLGLQAHANRGVRGLSGGERQKVALARALAIRPSAILLDEPLSSVDRAGAAEVMDILQRVHRDMHTPILHVTHRNEIAMALASRVHVMIGGRIVQEGGVEEVFRRPVNMEVAAFLGPNNLLIGRGNGKGGVVVARNTLIRTSSAPRGECRLIIRPEDIVLSKMAVKSSARNCIPARIVEIKRMARVMAVSLKAQGGLKLTAYVTPGAMADLGLGPGMRVYAVFKATAVHVL